MTDANKEALRIIKEVGDGKILNLAGLKLTFVPKEIAQLKNLTTLYLDNNPLTQLPKEIAQLKKLNTLNLQGNQLKQLPREIAQLKNLTTLRLQDNQLTQLPKEIAQLQKLTALYLQGNELTQLPREIAQLKNLTTLNLQGNQLKQFPREIAQLKNLTTLNLQGTQLTQLPKEIAQLKNLTVLNLGGNPLTQLPKEIAQLQKLTALYLQGNQLKQLPREITQLKNLTTLHLQGTQLTQLPKEIAQLQKLTALYLQGNELTQLPKEITQLQNLTKLDLRNNQLIQFPKEITQLKKLAELWLENNQLKQFPEEIVQLKKLEKFDWAANQLTQLPKEIMQLKNLTELWLENNQLTQLPKEIAQLQNLTRLNLRGNHLTQFPKEIAQLQNLTTLNLQDNQLTQLPKEIAQLKKLNTLHLQNNQLKQLPEEFVQLQGLKFLDLANNQLKQLPQEFAQLQMLNYLDLHHNQLEVGKEVFNLAPKEQIQEILKWQEAQETGQLQPIHEAKVIFIGESNYGKTHLIEYLREGNINRKITTTHGIERSPLDIPHGEKPIKLNIWDLGGQEFMRSTHQFFFSERTLYVLVTLARRERNELNHWLRLASQLGNDAPVLIVINKIDLDDHDLDRRSLQRDYPNIVGFVRTCIKDKPADNIVAADTIKDLNAEITRVISNKELMPSIYERRRPEWFTVKEQLEKLEQEGKNYISLEEYEQLDHIKDLAKDEQISNLRLLSMLGAVVSFVDDPRLMDTNVINPQWIMDGVYSIINDKTIKDDNKGRFQLADLSRLLDPKRYPKNRYYFLLDLLEKFNLCYPVKGRTKTYYIPDLFEDVEPDFDWDSTDAMHFRYNYAEFPPDAFMTRFIVDMHQDIEKDVRWRSGVLISNGSCRAKVYQAYRKNIINIEIEGPQTERAKYLYSIRQTFRLLHKPFSSMEIKQEISYKNFWLNYPTLVKLEDKNRPYYHVELDEDLPITKILNGYSTLKERQTDILGRIEEKLDKVAEKIDHLFDLSVFSITHSTNLEYPNIFTLKPARQLANSQSDFKTPYDLQLYCSHPESIHPVGDPYRIDIPKEWIQKLAPYYNGLIKRLQQLAPLIRPSAYTLLGPNAYKPQNLNLIATKDYIGKLQGIGDSPKLRAYEPKAATEAELQIIKQILDEADPGKEWMNYLQKVVHGGKILWVCPQHAVQYPR